jgi:hypothetical protein
MFGTEGWVAMELLRHVGDVILVCFRTVSRTGRLVKMLDVCFGGSYGRLV